MKKVIVVGSGAGGATIAKELQGKFQVTVIEAGGDFRPFSANLKTVERAKKTPLLFFDERGISWIFPNMKVRKASGGMVLVNGVGRGGTTNLSAGNAMRCDRDLKEMGIDLDAEFEELYSEVPVSCNHEKRWHDATREVYDACQEMKLRPRPTPKMIRFERCAGCGKCVLGCPRGAKWDSRLFLDQALQNGANLVSGRAVRRVVIEKGVAKGVLAGSRWRTDFYPADLVILAAGGLGTPPILQQSGIACEPRLFVDPVLCVAARWDGCRQNQEMPMPFIVQQDHFMISPYFDFLSFFFDRRWHMPSSDIFSLMIKLADDNTGSVTGRKAAKRLSDIDKSRLRDAVGVCTDIFRKLGKRDNELFLGTINAGHPGGMFPLTEANRDTLHNDRLPSNLCVADACLLPASPGGPPILTIAALAKRIGKLCVERNGQTRRYWAGGFGDAESTRVGPTCQTRAEVI